MKPPEEQPSCDPSAAAEHIMESVFNPHNRMHLNRSQRQEMQRRITVIAGWVWAGGYREAESDSRVEAINTEGEA